jgi:hypothetical protein
MKTKNGVGCTTRKYLMTLMRVRALVRCNPAIVYSQAKAVLRMDACGLTLQSRRPDHREKGNDDR